MEAAPRASPSSSSSASSSSPNRVHANLPVFFLADHRRPIQDLGGGKVAVAAGRRGKIWEGVEWRGGRGGVEEREERARFEAPRGFPSWDVVALSATRPPPAARVRPPLAPREAGS